jgi:Acetyltransferase (GNAT) domain
MSRPASEYRSDFPAMVDAYLRTASVTCSSVSNLSTHIDSVGHAERRVPVSVNGSEPDNTWICSPHTAYARYSIEELARLRRPWITMPLSGLCRLLGSYFWRARLDDAVVVNNWLLSTNLYPDCEPHALRGWLNEALDRWPRHAIWFRSLNTRYTPEWLNELSKLGFKMIPSRQVYLYDRIDANSKSPQNLRRDLDLLRGSAIIQTNAHAWRVPDFERAAELYSLLYIEKYSRLNPQYTASYLHAWHDAGLLELTGFRNESGSLVAVLGTFTIGTTITAPIVGYDTRQPVSTGLYRLLMALVYEHAARSRQRINLSAGAAHFKRLRGGIGAIEYSAVYDRHLPRRRRAALSFLSSLTTRIGVPFMRRLEL